MNEIFDKLLLLLCCLTLYLFHGNITFAIVPIVISIALSSLFFYYDSYKFKLLGTILFTVICLFLPFYIIFLPLLLYDTLNSKYQYIVLVIPFLMICNIDIYNSLTASFTLIFLFVSFLLKYKTDHLIKHNLEYNDLRDSSAQMSLLLKEKNQSLLKNQDFEVNLATLNERNRISKEIHDNIGHLLSRALLQVGALQVITREETTKAGLTDLKESLSAGMDQIRSSIHNMYDESIDLYAQIENLVKQFTFCMINYDYDIINPPPLPLKHSLIAITKEALANIIRHSNATKVNIVLREHPAMYQLIIQDNGQIDSKKISALNKIIDNQESMEGMGIRNICDRVRGFGGNINISIEHGFKIFISIPKKSI